MTWGDRQGSLPLAEGKVKGIAAADSAPAGGGQANCLAVGHADPGGVIKEQLNTALHKAGDQLGCLLWRKIGEVEMSSSPVLRDFLLFIFATIAKDIEIIVVFP